jgi:predicted DNA-binding transcriptional regulator AlpA
MSATPKLLSPAHVAGILGIKPQSLAVRRMKGTGPPYVRLGERPGSRVAYREEDVRRWIADRPTFSGTAEEKQRAHSCGDVDACGPIVNTPMREHAGAAMPS